MKEPIFDFHKIRLGISNSYLIQGKTGYVLVDAGDANQEKVFVRHLKKHGIPCGKVELIVITHVHFDHVGSLRAIKRLCNCPVAVHEKEAPLLRDGVVVIPTGANLFGKAAACLARNLPRGLMRFPPVEPDITLSEDLSLDEFGIAGRIMATPGHTEGSLSVLLSTGEAFVGDLAANYLPFGLGPILPPFAEDVGELFESWKKLLSAGATIIAPGHGRPFRAELLKRKLLSKSLLALSKKL